MEQKVSKYPHKFLVIGIAFVIIGVMLLLWTQGLLPGFMTLWPVPIIIIGITFLYFAFMRQKTEVLILPGMFFILGGTLLLLLNTVLKKSDISRIWPAFMLVCGLSFIPFGFKKKPKQRMVVFVPALTIIVLSIIFFPFSLGISPISFSRFISLWWPVIPIGIGLFFIITYLSDRRKKP